MVGAVLGAITVTVILKIIRVIEESVNVNVRTIVEILLGIALVLVMAMEIVSVRIITTGIITARR